MSHSKMELGSYGKKQLHETGGVISWSHRRRFIQAAKYLENYAPSQVLDYGCGDGTFLLTNRTNLKVSFGVDIDADQIDCCRKRNRTDTVFEMLTPEFVEKHRSQFDLIFCLEVIEHCLPEQRREIFENMRKLLRPEGTVIISVPNEIGMSLLAKEFFRALAGMRKLGQYQFKEKYTLGELGKMIFADARTAIDRPVFSHQDKARRWHGHKGFNWKSLNVELERHFVVKGMGFSPMPVFSSVLNSQIWFELQSA